MVTIEKRLPEWQGTRMAVMPREPRMRASYIQGNLHALELLGPEHAARIHAALGPGLTRTIRQASRVDWLPLSVDLALTAAVFREVGIEGLRAWGRNALLVSADGPLLRPILRAAISLFGLTPLSLLRHMPMAWRQVYQECGVVRVEQVTPRELRIHVDGLPEAMAEDTPYLEGIAGAIEGALQLARSKGTVSLSRASTVSVVFDVIWEPLA
jgi:hypothetical protein